MAIPRGSSRWLGGDLTPARDRLTPRPREHGMPWELVPMPQTHMYEDLQAGGGEVLLAWAPRCSPKFALSLARPLAPNTDPVGSSELSAPRTRHQSPERANRLSVVDTARGPSLGHFDPPADPRGNGRPEGCSDSEFSQPVSRRVDSPRAPRDWATPPRRSKPRRLPGLQGCPSVSG